VSIRDLSASQFSQLSRLLDEALEIPVADRGRWLADIQGLEPAVAQLLRDMLAAWSADPPQDLLATGDLLRRHLERGMPPDPGLIGRSFGPYRVLSLIGQGGMGSVWLAERVDGLFERKVALKLINTSLVDPVTTERLGREREILASLDHPNIARLLDAGFADDGQPYLALEYVSGVELNTYCDARRLSIRGRLELFRQIFAAVQYAHALLVVHRDLKPANILVTEAGQVRLLDFGIAKLLAAGEAKETELTQLGGRALTPAYAAPEQITGQTITTAADVYSLGVMLYEALTGGRPYRLKRDSRGALEDAILQAEPIAPSRFAINPAAANARGATVQQLAKILRGDLDAIVLKALKKAPTERYGTVEVFSEDVARYLRGDVVLAQRDTLAYRAVKFARRNWIPLTAASALFLALAGGLAATTYEARIADAERDAGQQAQLRALTQTAAARLHNADVGGAMNVVLEILQRRSANGPLFRQALSVFQEARADDLQVSVITGHTDQVFCAAFSPDGKQLVTGSLDRTARIWDAVSGREVRVLVGHTDWVSAAVFSPDGRQIVTASSDRSVRIWDAATGRQLLSLLGHTDAVRSARFSPDGAKIVTASRDNTARIWDAATGQQLRLLAGHSGALRSAAFSPDGTRIVTASSDGTAQIWDVASGRQIEVLSGHTERLYSAMYSPDGTRIVTASFDKTARVWDAATGRQILLLNGHTDGVYGAVFSPDGGRIVTVSVDRTARIWDAATGRQIRLLSGHTDEVETAAFSPDGKLIVTASADKSVRIWDDSTARQMRVLRGHKNIVYSAAFSPSGTQIVTASADSRAGIWNSATGQAVTWLNGHTDGVVDASYSPDGKRVVTASLDRTARIWDVATGQSVMVLTGHSDSVASAAFSPDGSRVVTTSVDKTARIWDCASGRQLSVLLGHTDQVDSAAFSPDGKQVVTASWDKTARIWDSASGRQVRLLAGHTDWLASATFSPDGRSIVTASNDKSVRIWDASSGRQQLVIKDHTDQVDFAAYSPDGRKIVAASHDKSVRIWDAATGRQLLMLNGFADPLMSAAFSPDGSQIVTASFDKTARIFDARVPAIDTQIKWAEAAQFDPLPASERFELGLAELNGAKEWPAVRSQCDESAAAPYDPQRRAPGVALGQITADIAMAACAGGDAGSRNRPQAQYQYGRALMAGGRFSDARRAFEQALSDGYRAAQIDLALLYAQPSAGMLDLPQAVSLYQRAWNDGLQIAAFQLGALYEHGVPKPGDGASYVLPPDAAQGWVWYTKGADAGEPYALARFADGAALAAFAQVDPATRRQGLLAAFKYYAAAAQRASGEDWPDDIWRNWRYRRATIARLLAREGMMDQVAAVYDEIRKNNAHRAGSLWARLEH
jgi:WD40 repeat protein/tRNA A-37 threonylcarbamoyl transferase component Bud32